MKTYSASVKVEAEHIDRGDHANWISQLKIAQDVHFLLRDQLGIGLEELKDKHGLFLVISNVYDVSYRKQLRLGDIIDVEVTIWISRPTSLEVHCLFRKDGQVATEMSWLMPLASTETGRVQRLPQWIVDAVGVEKPAVSMPASTH